MPAAHELSSCVRVEKAAFWPGPTSTALTLLTTYFARWANSNVLSVSARQERSGDTVASSTAGVGACI